MDILNEGLDALPYRAFPFCVAEARQLVASKGLLKDRY